jgi:hypothetical protein
MAIGYMVADMVDFAFFFDPNVLRFCDLDLQEVTNFGAMEHLPHLIAIDPDLLSKGWKYQLARHRNAGSTNSVNISGNPNMRAVIFGLGIPGNDPSKSLVVQAGQVKNVFQCNFKKLAPGTPLGSANIGIGVKTNGGLGGGYQPKFGYGSLFLWYRNVATSSDNRQVRPHLFLYRSGSSVVTNAASNVESTMATLNGVFNSGTLPASTTILDTIGNFTSGTGVLSNDNITSYGFIYSTDSVAFSTTEFSNTITIEGNSYPAPTSAEIAAGEFSRGGYDFNIIMTNNSRSLEFLNYVALLSDLLSNQKYYVWSYMQYRFETSDVFPAVGNIISFTTFATANIRIIDTGYSKVGIDSCAISNVNLSFCENEKVNLITSDDLNTNNDEFKIYPNPATNGSKITISLKLQDNEQPYATVYIFDLTGKMIRTHYLTNHSTEVVVDLASGTYVIRIRTKSGKEFVEKIIIQK